MQYSLINWHLQATSSHKLLNDSLLDEDGWQEAADWLADECFTHLADAGLQVVAWVMPRHPVAFYDTSRVLASLTQLRVDTFGDAQAAYDWLHNQSTLAQRLSAAGLPPLLTVATFLALPPAEQLHLIEQQGHPQMPRWEADYYVQPYRLPANVLVELRYHVHSGQLYQLRACLLSANQ
ncbi:hypothetical protein HHL22_17120 [Hymenobacter sp. RP-2-7]|uniref:Uncharacterized protein n=1 Tax=Hymenobacter polaris TaxID=2682546 RepID=A0A7Y0FP14_9BACT|nr:hypothetical protein [Hymenobacter polaris]NML66929.1 hypothetical protein [Hymenobacter polaris]